jgi:hypothetical protein
MMTFRVQTLVFRIQKDALMTFSLDYFLLV